MLTSETEAREYVRSLCDARAFELLEVFVERLKEASARQNLISRSTLDTVWQRHVADSAQILRFVSCETQPLLDLGSGAGFPGLVLSIMRPELPVILVESRSLRCWWLSEMIALAHATNCRIEGVDIGKVGPLLAQTITARAFAPLIRMLKLSARFSTIDTDWVLPKGRSARQEVAELPEVLRARFHVEQSLTDRDAGIIVGKGRMEPPK